MEKMGKKLLKKTNKIKQKQKQEKNYTVWIIKIAFSTTVFVNRGSFFFFTLFKYINSVYR